MQQNGGGQQGPRADINGTIKSIDGNTFVIAKRNFPTPSGSPQNLSPDDRDATRTAMQNMPPADRDATRTALENIPVEEVTLVIPTTATISKQQGGRGTMGSGRIGSGQNNGTTGTAQQRQSSQTGTQPGQTRPTTTRVLGSFADLEVGATVQLWFDTKFNDGKTVKQVVVMPAQGTSTPQAARS